MVSTVQPVREALLTLVYKAPQAGCLCADHSVSSMTASTQPSGCMLANLHGTLPA